MRLKSRTWFILSLLLFLAAGWFWHLGNQRQREKTAPAPAPTNPAAANLSAPAAPAVSPASNAVANTVPPRFPYRLSNSIRNLDELMRNERAVLLQNAFIDTASRAPLNVPDFLRAKGEHGSYIVQSRGRLNDAFRGLLREAGATIVSYIPNNAYLVRVSAAGAQRLASLPQTQAVLPFEPYYKLDERLLALAIEQQPLPEGRWVNVIAFADAIASARLALEKMGAQIITEEVSPFGQRFIVRPPGDALVALANLPAVQGVEGYFGKALLNDLSRQRLKVATNTLVTTLNYLGLTGSNALVNINDTGVDAGHPDLTGRVTADIPATLMDADGHGTHVAGTIASSGTSSPGVSSNNIPGSVTNASFRGIAPGASLYATPVIFNSGVVFPALGDTYLQTNAATRSYITLARTNALISNNSWGYGGAPVYNTSAASYDAAVRDALPEVTGSQPILFVFAAGNGGSGADDGTGGVPDSILSPGTAKNVITVGAIENLRNITNFTDFTDNSNQVASFSSRGNVGIGLEGTFGRFKPDLVAPGTFTVSARTRSWTNSTDTNIAQLDMALTPYYRYESGTSMAAPAVSGLLALMEEFFESQLQIAYSPALMKALLINGARSAGSKYDLLVNTTNYNYQGWGVPNLTNSIPNTLLNGSASPLQFFDQSPTNALATGESHSYVLKLNPLLPEVPFFPLRITLVWTDPPGNPSAATKLVNDLDLLVTSSVTNGGMVTTNYFFGNNFEPGSDFTMLSLTNNPPTNDIVNNVENVYLNVTLDAEYVVTVKGARINVNAVTAHTNNVVQDYALVISSESSTSAAPFSITRMLEPTNTLPVLPLTNGVPLLHQRVGANTPLLGGTNGVVQQWNFYVFTNVFVPGGANITNGPNVAFITFQVPNLSRPRNLEADIDLFVSTDPTITNLNPLAIDAAFRATSRGGTETIFFTNAPVGPNSVFYLGVKSEDKQAAEFGLVALSTVLPFAQTNECGLLLTGLPSNVQIPDGAPDQPQGNYVFAICPQPWTIQRVLVTNVMTHELFGDLFGDLTHDQNFAVLNNHGLTPVYGTNVAFVYDDSGRNDFPGSVPSSGPGSLNNFVGTEGLGAWIFTINDNALKHTGRVDNLSICLEQQDTNANNRLIVVPGNQCLTEFVDVPVNVTNLIVTLSQLTGPLDVYIRQGAPPTTTVFDKSATINPPGGSLTLGLADFPPLVSPGRYFLLLCNPSASPVTGNLSFQFEFSLTPLGLLTFTTTNAPLTLRDDALLNSIINVSNNHRVVDVKVGVRIDHPRLSDLVLHLVSPQGTRVLLTEGRGGTNATNYGFTFTNALATNPPLPYVLTNFSWVTFTESTNLAKLPVKFAPTPFASTNTNPFIYVFTNGFEVPPALPIIQGTNVQGTVFDGWLVETNAVAVLGDTNVALGGSNYLVLSSGRVSRFLPTVPDQVYQLNFGYRKISSAATQSVALSVPVTANLYFQTNMLASNTPPVSVPKLRLCPGQQVVITATNCNPVDLALPCRGPEGDTNLPPYQSLPAFSLIGQWSRSPKVLETNTTWGLPFYIGTNAVLTAPIDPGDYYLFLGENDSDYTDNSGAFDVIAEWQQCQLASFEWVLGGVTNLVFGESHWKTNSFLFAGNLLTTNFFLQPSWNYTMIFDNFELFEPISTVYDLPEEPLKVLQNQLGPGEWKLEVQDCRAGPSTDLGTLWSWYLQIQFAPEPLSVALTNCVLYTNFVRSDLVNGREIKYFSVEVPREATRATNTFTGGGVELLYSRTGLPLGTSPPDPVLYPLPNPWIITTNFPVGAELLPGGRYFLGVRNLNPAQTNNFTLRVDFDLPLIMLDNNRSNCVVGITNLITTITNLQPAVTNIITPGTNMQWYKYFVFQDPNTNTTGVSFELISTNVDVHLVAKRALAVVDYLPTPTNFDYQSIECHPVTNRIVVLTNSFPVPLEPVLWILGVYNVGPSNADYELKACQWTNSPAAIYQADPPHVIPLLTNDLAFPFFVLANNATNILLTNLFIPLAILDQTNSGVLFEICGLSGDADLLVRRSDLPSHTLFDFSDIKPGTNDETIVLRTNLFIPNLNATNWYLTIVNHETNPVTGMIRYMVATNGMLTNCSGITILAPKFVKSLNGVALSWNTLPGQKYQVQGSLDLMTWTTLTNVTAAGDKTSFLDPDPGNTRPRRFYRVLQVHP